jgi:uroporphyrin-III C-methyltransferase
MGVSRCAELQRALLEAGMAADMPVVVVQNASRDDEQRIASRLHTLVTDMCTHNIGSPAIIIAGRAAATALYTEDFHTLRASS